MQIPFQQANTHPYFLCSMLAGAQKQGVLYIMDNSQGRFRGKSSRGITKQVDKTLGILCSLPICGIPARFFKTTPIKIE